MILSRILALLLSGSAVAGPSLLEGQRLAPRTFTEELTPRVRVAGETVVGIVAGDPDRMVDPAAITVALPRTGANLLCVRVRSQDASFTAESDYDLASVPAGTVTLSFPTQYSPQLRTLRARQLALRVWAARSCTADPVDYLLAAWGSAPPGDRVTVLVNSRDHVTTLRLAGGSGESGCRAVRDEVVTAYNLNCPLMVPVASEPLQVTVRRRRGPHELPRIRFGLVRP